LNDLNVYSTSEFQIMIGYNYNDKMKNKYHTVGTVPKYNRNFIKTEPKSIPYIVSHQRDEEQNNLGAILAVFVSKLYSQCYNFIYFPSMFHDLPN